MNLQFNELFTLYTITFGSRDAKFAFGIVSGELRAKHPPTEFFGHKQWTIKLHSNSLLVFR